MKERLMLKDQQQRQQMEWQEGRRRVETYSEEMFRSYGFKEGIIHFGGSKYIEPLCRVIAALAPQMMHTEECSNKIARRSSP